MPAAKGKCCCCHIVTAGAIVGVFQTMVVVLVISKAATIYSKRDTWGERADERNLRNFFLGSSGDSFPLQSTWTDSFNTTATRMALLEIGLSDTIALHAVWLVFLALYGLAFKYGRAVLVVPNLMMTLFSLVWGILWMISLVLGLIDVLDNWDRTPLHQHRDDDMKFASLAIVLVFVFIFWFAELVFFVILKKFYSFLKEQGIESQNRLPIISRPMTAGRHPINPAIQSHMAPSADARPVQHYNQGYDNSQEDPGQEESSNGGVVGHAANPLPPISHNI